MEHWRNSKTVIGFGDRECGKDCPARKVDPVTCQRMVLCTEARVAATMEGYISESSEYRRKQAEYAAALGCRPGMDRI